VLIVATSAMAACGLSPLAPSELDSDVLFTLEPIPPVRFPTAVSYSFGFSVSNPGTGTTVRLGEILFTVYGPDGIVYGSTTHRFNHDFGPGTSIGGATGVVSDFNLSRPLATRYTGRLSYTRADGRSVVLERESTFSPPR
jgi:hypothetical protein